MNSRDGSSGARRLKLMAAIAAAVEACQSDAVERIERTPLSSRTARAWKTRAWQPMRTGQPRPGAAWRDGYN